MERNSQLVYDLIQKKATSNEFLQGVSGFFGFPVTLVVDAGVVFTHYGPMLDEIRSIYGRKPVSYEVIQPILEACKSEIVADIIVDKIMGNIPVIGIAANIMCAKTMTWRMGLLFAMLSSSGEDISVVTTKNTIKAIRKLFPQRNMFSFTTPSICTVEKLLTKFLDCPVDEFDSKVNRILDAI